MRMKAVEGGDNGSRSDVGNSYRSAPENRDEEDEQRGYLRNPRISVPYALWMTNTLRAFSLLMTSRIYSRISKKVRVVDSSGVDSPNPDKVRIRGNTTGGM